LTFWQIKHIVGINRRNKAGGAGYQVTAYTQSGSDIESGIGSKPKGLSQKYILCG
jgi:hypothetical protein